MPFNITGLSSFRHASKPLSYIGNADGTDRGLRDIIEIVWSITSSRQQHIIIYTHGQETLLFRVRESLNR